MWPYIKFVLGLLLILMAVVGCFAVVGGDMGEGIKRIARGGVDTVGVIDRRIVHYTGVRVGRVVGGGRSYTIHYSFRAKDGRKYGGKVDVTKEQAEAASDGQQIAIRYYSKNPSINAALAYKSYAKESDAKKMPVGTVIFTMLLFLLVGGWMVWSAWVRIAPAYAPRLTGRNAASRIDLSSRLSSPSRVASMGTARPARARPAGFGNR